MRTTYQLLALAACSLTLAGGARDPATPVSDAVRSAAARAEKNFIAAAEDMPADALCSSIGWVPAPKRPELGAGASKEELVVRLRETFRFCETALSKVNDSRLGGMVPYFGSVQSRAG